MDLNGILRNYGSILEAGRSAFTWNADGTLKKKVLSLNGEVIFTKTFVWNADGSLKSWSLEVETTGEVITKRFTWNADGSLNHAVAE